VEEERNDLIGLLEGAVERASSRSRDEQARLAERLVAIRERIARQEPRAHLPLRVVDASGGGRRADTADSIDVLGGTQK